jgi:drug/metabolite transporter (DMT)-like permease
MPAAADPRPLLALVVRLGAIGALSTMAALIKYTEARGVHLVEILFWRQFLAIPILLAWALATGAGMAAFATNRLGAHARRGIYGLIGMVLNFGAVVLLPLAEATTMNFTAPVWAVILSVLILKDRPGVWRWSSVLLGFAGVLLIARPGSGDIPLGGAAVALGGAFMIALISIQVADLGRTEKPLTIVFWFAMVSAPICALGLPFVGQAHDPQQWLLLAAIGVTGTVGQLLLTAALRFGEVASVIVMDYSALFWAALYGALLFGALPAAGTWVGAPLIVAAGLIITWREHHLARRRLAASAGPGGT